MTRLHIAIDRLEAAGVRFSIAGGADGFVARVGDYLNETSPYKEVPTIEEAILWVCSVSSAPAAAAASRRDACRT